MAAEKNPAVAQVRSMIRTTLVQQTQESVGKLREYAKTLRAQADEADAMADRMLAETDKALADMAARAEGRGDGSA